MYKSFAMGTQTDATRCCIIVILLIQLSLGVIRENMGLLPLPKIIAALDFLQMCFEMISDQECGTVSPFG